MSEPAAQDLVIQRGDDTPFTITFSPADTSIVGGKVWLTIKKRESDSDSAALLRVNTEDDPAILHIDDATHASGELPAAKTARLPIGTWVYDVQARTPDGKIRTTQRGRAVVEFDVTRATT